MHLVLEKPLPYLVSHITIENINMYLTHLPKLSTTERAAICTQFKYGCCGDVEEAIIPAQGPNQSGCPTACKCHVLGKNLWYTIICCIEP